VVAILESSIAQTLQPMACLNDYYTVNESSLQYINLCTPFLSACCFLLLLTQWMVFTGWVIMLFVMSTSAIWWLVGNSALLAAEYCHHKFTCCIIVCFAGTVIGGNVMLGFFSLFDRETQRIGFAASTCECNTPVQL